MTRQIADAHVDLPYFLRQMDQKLPFEEIKEGPFTFEEAIRANVNFFVSAVYLEDRFNGSLSLAHFYHSMEYANALITNMALVKTGGDLKKQEGSTPKTLFLVENSDFLADDLRLIFKLKGQGIFILGLTHAKQNRLADGNDVKVPEGLSKLGREVLEAMEKEGLILDLSHLHLRCFYQALDAFKGHMMVSHTGIRDVYDTPRNIYLSQVEELIQRDGIVGISINPELLWDQKGFSLERLYAHIDTIAQAYGPLCICLGSDVCGFEMTGITYERAIESLEEILLVKGYGNSTYEILYGNIMRFLSKALTETL